jgi:hypothetical protein
MLLEDSDIEAHFRFWIQAGAVVSATASAALSMAAQALDSQAES